MIDCYKCEVKREHPWHDNGTINEACDMRVLNGIDWFKEARESMIKRREAAHAK